MSKNGNFISQFFLSYFLKTYVSSKPAAGADCLLLPKSPPPLETPKTDGNFALATVGAVLSNPKIAAHWIDEMNRMENCKKTFIL